MKIQINEVWNDRGASKALAVIECNGNPYCSVRSWVAQNRPDLDLADGLFSHGYHAEEVA